MDPGPQEDQKFAGVIPSDGHWFVHEDTEGECRLYRIEAWVIYEGNKWSCGYPMVVNEVRGELEMSLGPDADSDEYRSWQGIIHVDDPQAYMDANNAQDANGEHWKDK